MKRGFTLIELLAVTAIFASLMALMFPVFVSAKASAKSAVCLSNLHQIGLATSLYSNDHDTSFPLATNYFERYVPSMTFGRPLEIDPSKEPTPLELLSSYAKNKEIFICPEDRGLRIRNVFEAFPRFYSRNGGASYLFSEVYSGQNESTWNNPSNALWTTDGATNWHIPNPDPFDFSQDHINALAFDFHVKTLANRNAPTHIE